jgi:hypothetical protein
MNSDALDIRLCNTEIYGSGRSVSKWDMVREESFRKLEEIVARVAY